MPGPLAGVRVLDFTLALAGPFCGLVLADLGADVIKIESPDPDIRTAGGLSALKGENGHFLVVNRNKRGLSIDLKDERGRAAFYRLVESADVLVQNYRPGVMKRLGADYETLHQINPRLIYCSISGFGEGSPYADLAGLDLIAQGMSGLMSVTGDPKGGEPVKAGTPVTDMGSGMYGAIGILSALYHREQTGQGQHVEATLLDTPISWLTWRAAEYWGTGKTPGPQGSGLGAYRAFKCSDGRWVNIGPTNRLWRATCETLGVPHLIDDPRFATMTLRNENHEELTEELQQAFLTKPSDEWIAAFQKVGVPTGPIKTVPEVLEHDPHVKARQMVVEVDHPRLGRMKTLGVPVKLSETPGAVTRAAPTLGQHTVQVLLEVGYSREDVEALREAGVIYVTGDEHGTYVEPASSEPPEPVGSSS
ncbi:MAG: CoA transferase [Chloroflexi bacterium]|nr:CoA transferase [Chloroflexota bacterium]